jgi:hypothetical protein
MNCNASWILELKRSTAIGTDCSEVFASGRQLLNIIVVKVSHKNVSSIVYGYTFRMVKSEFRT